MGIWLVVNEGVRAFLHVRGPNLRGWAGYVVPNVGEPSVMNRAKVLIENPRMHVWMGALKKGDENRIFYELEDHMGIRVRSKPCPSDGRVQRRSSSV